MEIPDNPNWQQVLAFLRAHVRPADRILAPDHFLNEFALVYPLQIRRHWIAFDFDWFVLHVEGIARLDRAIVADMLAHAAPVFANPVFFVFARRDDLPRRSLQEPAFMQLNMYLMANGLIGAAPAPAVRRGAVMTTYNRPAMLERSAAAVIAAGAELLVVDDGSAAEHAAANRTIAERAGAAYLGLPANRGLPTALNCGIAYFLADEGVTWISTFNDDVAVDRALYQRLAPIEASREFPLMTGYLSPHHKVLGSRTVNGVAVQLCRSLSGLHMHGARDYWRALSPIPTPYLGAPKPTGGFPGQGADEDWWVGSYSPHAVAKAGGFIAAIAGLVDHRGAAVSTWGQTAQD